MKSRMMKNRMIVVVLGVAALAAPALAQTASSSTPQVLPPALEKQLAARAANVSEVTLGKNMLAFAAKYMKGKNKHDAATRQLIEGLDGVYVRDYKFDKPGEYSMAAIDKVREHFKSPEWTPIVHTRDIKTGESTDVMMKMVNGESHGMFVLSVQPKELSIVLILGPIHMDQMGKLSGLSGLGSLKDAKPGKAKADTTASAKESGGK